MAVLGDGEPLGRGREGFSDAADLEPTGQAGGDLYTRGKFFFFFWLHLLEKKSFFSLATRVYYTKPMMVFSYAFFMYD